MFLTLPKSTPCSQASSTEDSKTKSYHRHSSLFSLVKSKKEKRKSKPYTYPIDTSSPLLPTDAPPAYDSIAPKFHISNTSEITKSPSLNSPTRSRSQTRGKSHLRRPSKPWTNPPNAPSQNQQEFYPTNVHGRKVAILGTPPKDGLLCPYSTFYPAQGDDMSAFSPFGSAPSAGGFYRSKEVERKGRRISTGCAWEKIGERRAREGVGRWA
jgi:hypothetical protein